MRLCHVAGVAGLGALLASGCANGHMPAYRPAVPDVAHPTAKRIAPPDIAHPKAQRVRVPDVAHPTAKRIAPPDIAHPKAQRVRVPDVAHLTARRAPLPDLAHAFGPRQAPALTARVDITGPDSVLLLDGNAVAGELTRISPTALYFADGASVARRDVRGINFGATQAPPPLGAHPLHDAVGLREGPTIDAAVLAMENGVLRMAVYGPSGTRLETVQQTDVRAIAMRDRRNALCERAALLFGEGAVPNRPVAELARDSIDTVHVMWFLEPGGERPDTILRCRFRERGAPACSVVQWGEGDAVCSDVPNPPWVRGVADDESRLSEETEFYYALRKGERTLGTSNVLTRGSRHRHTSPARLDTPYRGEAHYWESRTRDVQAQEGR